MDQQPLVIPPNPAAPSMFPTSERLKFAKMYNEIIHSGKFTQILIDLENSYQPALEEIFKTRDKSLEELQSKNSKVIEEAIKQLGQLHTEATISQLSSQHCYDMERLLNNWNMTVEALKDAQKENFYEKLSELYQDLLNGKEVTREEMDDSPEPAASTSSVDQIIMEESFTINLGSQLKTAHNLRILAVDTLYMCDNSRFKPLQSVRAQTAMSLYSNNLSGIVLLVDNHFQSYYGIQHEFAELCNNQNEFHFDNFSKQIKHIKESILPNYAGRSNLEAGDVYITRHSNLANAHVVFHLVIDDSLKQEVNSRHKIMTSLRNILRVAHIYDLKTISIPLLLIDEMDEEILTVSWCLKRAELVLKCVKGFLIEMASASTGIDQGTIQFLVPKGISEELFTSLASLIPEVFRLANSVNLKSRNL